MKLENQVCSLEFAKKLKELGVKQDSLFWWTRYDTCGGTAGAIDLGTYVLRPEAELPKLDEYRDCFSAFTVSELGEMIPNGFKSGVYPETKDRTYFCIKSSAKNHEAKNDAIFWKDTEADARARMVIHLIENKLVVD